MSYGSYIQNACSYRSEQALTSEGPAAPCGCDLRVNEDTA
jgi:hypothetical protein